MMRVVPFNILLLALAGVYGECHASDEKTYNVSIGTIAAGFSPKSLTINVGDTILWTNDDTITHTTTHTPLSGDPLWDSTNMFPTDKFSYKFTRAGTFPYFCTSHPEMIAKVIVKAKPLTKPLIQSDALLLATAGKFFQHMLQAAGSAPLTYTTTPLPEGLVLSDSTISGVPSVPGTYAIEINLRNTVGSDSQTLVIAVLHDSDGDGFTDEQEIAIGSLPNDSASTPFNGNPSMLMPLDISSAKFSLNFAQANKDSLTVAGSLPYTGDQAVALAIDFDVGGVVTRFQPNPSGVEISGSSTLKIKRGTKVGAKFTLTAKNASLNTRLADEGMTSLTIRNAKAGVAIAILMDGMILRTIILTKYSAVASKTGKAALIKQ